GIARTTDGGRTWTIVHEEPDRPSSNLRGSWVEERALEDGYSVWFDAPTDLGVGPADPDLCFATDLFRTYRTRDGGKTWTELNSAPRGNEAWVSRGLDVTTTYGVHFDPFFPRRVFVSTTDIGLFRSEDGGQSWIGSSRGVPKEWRNTAYWVVFDPEERGVAWAAFSGTHDLPRPKMWRHTDPASFRGGVGISTDGGRSWTPSWQGAPEGAVTHLLLDPTSEKGRRTLYACVFGRGLFKSTDGGRTWAARNTGIEGTQPFAWRLTRAGDGTLYLVVARRSEGGRIGDAGDGAVYRSRDGAGHWERMALPPGINGPNAVTVDPADPRRLYLSCWPVATPGGDTGGGLLLSEDAGSSWTRLRPDSEYVYDVSLDPRDARVLYFTGHDQAAWRSSDRGATWSRLQGFNFKQGTRVVPDPSDRSRVYITTFGSNVWYGPATGDPAATEDVVPAPQSRLEQLVEANIRGTHAFQVGLAKKDGKGDPACFATGALTDAQLGAIETHQAALLKSDVKAVRDWAEGKSSAFDAGVDLEPLLQVQLPMPEGLPVNVFSHWLAEKTRAPRASVRAIASLVQTNLEVERDGDRLQELSAFYIGLGLPVYLGQLGLPGSDSDFLEIGRTLEGRSCASPVGTRAADWQIAFRKNWNWGEKNLGIRDDKVLAAELLQEPAVAPLVPLMKAMPRRRIAVVGHSFTMQLHWSTPGAFVPVVTAMFARTNPAVEFRQFQAGGLTSSKALARFRDEVIAWKPDTVLLVVLNRTTEDLSAFARMGRDFAAAGARVVTFDDVHDPDASDPATVVRDAAAARESGMTVIEVGPLLASSPDRERFLCLDRIHMTEPYHRLMAKQWLGWLVGARTARLER
ncbi:MAG TPA: hypothetical protein VEQ10_13135, partial [Vicinamibacteria bacterium]|nr:hypothetical protein [Vicinamibacteria bacterium]